MYMCIMYCKLYGINATQSANLDLFCKRTSSIERNQILSKETENLPKVKNLSYKKKSGENKPLKNTYTHIQRNFKTFSVQYQNQTATVENCKYKKCMFNLFFSRIQLINKKRNFLNSCPHHLLSHICYLALTRLGNFSHTLTKTIKEQVQ